MQKNPWIAHRTNAPRARLRLFCFHHAGGAAYVFREWAARLPPTVELCPVQIPGRATRMDEKPMREAGPLVSALATGLASELVGPFAFFGHSLGAMLAFELARELRRRRFPGPEHLFVAARVAPGIKSTREPVHALPDREFFDAVRRRYNAIPDEIAREAELVELMLPILRADFTIHETYTYRPEPPLACPISAYGGTRDVNVAEQDLDAWRDETSSRFSMRMVEGDHFFIHAKGPTFMNALADELDLIAHRIGAATG